MEYSKEFKSLLNEDLPDGHIGQEPALDIDSEQYSLT